MQQNKRNQEGIIFKKTLLVLLMHSYNGDNEDIIQNENTKMQDSE